ncbi:hypothetical protein VP01_1652g3 [Puccinia sorghi]|uniref:Cyclin N-terminal domain-containing protein n=1 Tax=Puccinia sorghi TaxID=27349 RepID=A0A0L6VGI6_9BASI|nr:hypothetical protein VP01_1652g3 [Puccinia sorghi]
MMNTTSPLITRFINTDTPLIIKAIAAYLNHSIHSGDQQPATHKPTNRFQAQSKPAISTGDYLTRLINLSPLSIDGVLLGLVYLQRITHLNLSPEAQSGQDDDDLIPINSLTIHRLILSSMILGTKFISDRPLPRKRLSKVAGVSEIELDHLERELLNRLDFKLCWSNDELVSLTRNILFETQPPPSISLPSLDTTTQVKITPKSVLNRASFSAITPTSSNPDTTPINALLRRHSTTKGLVFVKSQFIDSNLLSEKYGFSTDIHSTQSPNAQMIDNLIDNPLITNNSSPSNKPKSTSKILVTRLEHNQIKICHAQVF